jgi:hypothetical protein
VTFAAEGRRRDLLRAFNDHLGVGQSTNTTSFEAPSISTMVPSRDHPVPHKFNREEEDRDYDEQGVLSALLWGNEDLKEQQLLSQAIMDSLRLSPCEDPNGQGPSLTLPTQWSAGDHGNYSTNQGRFNRSPRGRRQGQGNGYHEKTLARTNMSASDDLQIPFSPSYARSPPPLNPPHTPQQTSPSRASQRSPGGHRMAVVPLRQSPQFNDPNSGIWICKHCRWANSPWEGRCSSCREVPEDT